ncbi:MAG: class II glutamine amidotransferase, partial [Clostridia bacterium]|nr:class II glutamine amidotransferase [Clostridia bacterium]
KQEGKTDSERILYYLVDLVNKRQSSLKRTLTEEERFAVIDEMVKDMAVGNKLNLLLFDGEIMYAHTNYKNSLYCLQTENAAYFSTAPLSLEAWEPVKMTALAAYKEGKLISRGKSHGGEYVDDPENMNLIFIDYSGL